MSPPGALLKFIIAIYGPKLAIESGYHTPEEV